MDRLRLFVYLSSLVSLNTCVASNAERQDGELFRNYDGDFFNNPDDKCRDESCHMYNSTTAGGYCVSRACCRCRCNSDKTTYIVHEKQCMSLESFRKLHKLDDIHYLMGQPGESCIEACNHTGRVCLIKGHGFIDTNTTLSIFNSLNATCKIGSYDTDVYQFGGNPSHYITTGWKGRCTGFKNVPNTIDCARGGNKNLRRLCPCKGKKDCRYWLVDTKDRMGCSTYSSKIPLISLSTKGSARLKMCHELKHLSNCALEEIKYMKQTRWQTLGEKESRLFKVTTVQGPQGSTNYLMLEWNKLDREYDGILGYAKITCNINREQAMFCFIFKSNGSDYVPTSQPFVATDTKQGRSAPTKFVTPSFITRSGDNFVKEKKNKNISMKTSTIAAVSTSVLVFLLICVIIVAIFCWRRKKRKGTAKKLEHSVPTYSEGPGNTQQIHGRGGTMPEREEELVEYDYAYEMPDSRTKITQVTNVVPLERAFTESNETGTTNSKDYQDLLPRPRPSLESNYEPLRRTSKIDNGKEETLPHQTESSAVDDEDYEHMELRIHDAGKPGHLKEKHEYQNCNSGYDVSEYLNENSSLH